MKTWFESFNRMLQGEAPADELGLIPAGTSDMDFVIEHVRYQFSAKIREAVDVTFPESIKLLGQESYEQLWREFIQSNPRSPRALDYFPAVFLHWVLQREDVPWSLRQLMLFEHVLDTHPWTHPRLGLIDLPPLELSETTVIELPELHIVRFESPVVAIYNGAQVLDENMSQDVLFWLMDDGMNFHAMQPWERDVLERLPLGLGEALAYAPEDATVISDFFQWLGKSGLIRKISSL